MPDTRLLHGPYRAPSLRRGDRAICLYRDADVIVTSWTDARISWPRCQRRGQQGGAGLLVNEELLRAIRNESADALKYWFRVSTKAVWRWRKAFEVTRTNNAATNQLYRASAAKGAKVSKTRIYSKQERAVRRANAIRLNLGQYITPGYHGRWRTQRELVLLRKLTDEQIAKRTSRTINAVRVKRAKLAVKK